MREREFRAFIHGEMVYLPFAALQYFDFEGSYAMSFVVDAYAGFWSHEQYENATEEHCKDAPIMEFTGLTDKNVKKIYEDDIIQILYTDWASKERSDIRTLEQYLDDKSSFGVVVFNNSRYELESIPNKNEMSIHCGTHGFIKVIGNIHQNPELL